MIKQFEIPQHLLSFSMFNTFFSFNFSVELWLKIEPCGGFIRRSTFFSGSSWFQGSCNSLKSLKSPGI